MYPQGTLSSIKKPAEAGSFDVAEVNDDNL